MRDRQATRQIGLDLVNRPGLRGTRMAVDRLGQLGYRSIALDGGKRPLSFEDRCAVPARPFAATGF